MKKSKISIKLSINFAISLLIFSVIISTIFLLLFKNYTAEVKMEQIKKYAISLSDVLSNEDSVGFGGGNGYSAYVKFINKVSNADIWIVDTNGDLIITNIGHHNNNSGHNKKSNNSGIYNTTNLPDNLVNILNDVLNGNNTYIKDDNKETNITNITVGVPISIDNKVNGAVFLSSDIEKIPNDVTQALGILISSIVIALIIVLVLSFFLSYLFTKPLSKMKEVAKKLSNHDYSVRCNIDQNDEIGELSNILDTLAERLETADKQSEKLDKMQKEFISNISHELRTPITVMRGSLELLKENIIKEPEKIQEYYDQMILEAKMLERLVGDLLELSRLENTDFKIEMNTINLNDVINDVIRSSKQLANKKNINIKTYINTNQIKFLGDYTRLRQMFLIIMDNAIKFSKENSFIDLIVNKNEIIIKDYGKGIKKEDLEHIFDKFYKTNDKENKNGSGLGLAIASKIAKRHNIKLTAKNHEKGGAEFIFSLN